jgi:GNAT superfamily N-acetyltransferase
LRAPADFAISRIPPGFDRWDDLLSLIRASFAYMDGTIDPPSSAHRLTPALLRDKAEAEICFLASILARESTRTPDLSSPPELAGCAFLAERADHFYLGKLAVAPAYQGRGFGRRLLAAAEAHARDAGKNLIELQTRIELTGNQELFARLGFVETARTSHQGYDRPTSITMRKALA